MLNRKRIFAIVLFVLIGLFVYTFANPAEELEPLDNDNNVEDVDNNKDDENNNDDVIQLPEDDDDNIIPVIVNATNYDALRTAVNNGNQIIDLETEDEDLNKLLEQLETATNNGQQLINNQINDQNLVNTGANNINQLLVQINALLTGNLSEAIEMGNDLLDEYIEDQYLNLNLVGLLEDLDEAVDDAEELQDPTAQQMLDAATKIFELVDEINDLQNEIDIINAMTLELVPSTTDWTNQNVTLTAEIDIEDNALINDITIVRGSTCTFDEPLPTFSTLFENLVMLPFGTEELTVSENDDYTLCVTFFNGEEKSVTYPVENIDKVKPVFESPLASSHTTGKATVSVIEDNLGEIKIFNQDTNTYTVVSNGFELTDEATYHIFVTDLAGNKADIWTAIDRTLPTISGVENSEYYNDDVTVNIFDKFLQTVTVTNGENTVTYDRDDFAKNNKNENFNITLDLSDEGLYTIVGTDKVGNSTTSTFTIDKTTPRVAINYISNKDKNIEYNNLGDRVAIEFVSNEPLDLNAMNVTIAGKIAVFDTDKPKVANKYTYEIFVDKETTNGQVEFIINAADLAGNAISPIILDQKNYTAPRKYTAKIVIDTVAPIIDSISKNTDDWTNEDVTLSVNVTDNVNDRTLNPIKYSFNNGEWQEENTYVVTENTTVNVKVKDGAGNISETTEVVDKIDRIAPSVSFYQKGLSIFKQTQKSTPTVTDDLSGIDEMTFKYQWLMTNKQPSEESFTTSFTNKQSLLAPEEVTGDYWLWVLVEDNAGNQTITRSEKFGLDNTNPTINSILKSAEDWTNEDVILTVNATDNITDPKRINGPIKYSFNNGEWQEENTYVVTGNTTVNVKVKDGAGNISEATEVVVDKIDRDGPTINLNGTDQGKKYQQSHSRKITVTDNKSGVNASTLVYKWSTTRTQGFFADGISFASGDTLTTPTETGQYYLMINAYDNAGNGKWSATWAYYVDNTAPEISSVTKNPDNWTNGNVTLTVKATDNITNPSEMSGPLMYSFNNGEWQEENTYVVTENTTVNVKVKDGAGNISEATEVVVDKIDRVIPTVTNEVQLYEPNQDGRVKVTITFSEPITGLDFSNSQWRSTENVNEYYNYYYRTKNVTLNFSDLAGNGNSYTFTADRTLPTATFTYSNNNGAAVTPDDVTVTLTASEDIQDIAGWNRIDSKTFTKVYGENGKYSVDLKDLVGNPNTAKFEVKRIDKVAPIINGVENNGLYNGDVTYSIVETNVKNIIIDDVTYDEKGSKTGTISTEGMHTITVTDKALHSTTVTFTIDKTLPTVSSLTQQYEDGRIRVTVQYDEPVTGFLVGEVDDTYWRNLGNNLYYRYYTGTQDVTLSFSDLAGNTNSHTFTVDNTAPALAVQYIDLVLENGRDYNLLTGVSSDDINATIVATVNGNIVTNSNQLPVGIYTVIYTATDSIGNFSTATATLTVKVDFNINLHHEEGSEQVLWWTITWDVSAISFTNLGNRYSENSYNINQIELVTPEGNIDLGRIRAINLHIYNLQGIKLTREEYDLLVNGDASIKVTYKNKKLNLDNLVLYHTFQ